MGAGTALNDDRRKALREGTMSTHKLSHEHETDGDDFAALRKLLHNQFPHDGFLDWPGMALAQLQELCVFGDLRAPRALPDGVAVTLRRDDAPSLVARRLAHAESAPSLAPAVAPVPDLLADHLRLTAAPDRQDALGTALGAVAYVTELREALRAVSRQEAEYAVLFAQCQAIIERQQAVLKDQEERLAAFAHFTRELRREVASWL